MNVPIQGSVWASSRQAYNRAKVLSVFEHDGIYWVTFARLDRRADVATVRLSAFDVAYPYPQK